MNAFAIETVQKSLFPIPYNEAEKKIIRQGIRFYIEHVAKIPYQITASYLQSYHLLYWSGEHILLKLQESAGQIEKDGILYKVIYNQRQQLTRGKILSNKKAQYSMSFRVVISDYDLMPVVFISENL